MKILLLGLNGFVGRNLYEYFIKKNIDLDAPSHSELDILDEKKILNVLLKNHYDIVINALDSTASNSNYFEDRLRMYCNLAKYSKLYGKMIYFGSGAEYARELPIIKISEKEFDRKIPADTYGFCLYQMCKDAIESKNIYNFRLFGIFGKYELWQQRFISNAICKVLYGYPITIRQDRVIDYLYVDDLCKIVEWAFYNEPVYHHYNIVSGRSYRLSELAGYVKKVLDKDVPIYIAKEGLDDEYTADNSRIISEIKKNSIENIETSICNLSEYYIENIGMINKLNLLYQ
jgi:GDP-L-fucose synthase